MAAGDTRRTVVLGLGNLLYRDEGAGIHALQALTRALDPEIPVECVDGGVLGLSLLPIVEECDDLLVLDAVDAGQGPGALIELRGSEIAMYAGGRLSEHQVGFQDVLAVAAWRGALPERLHVVGVQPGDLSVGLELSAPVAAALPALVARAMEQLEKWTGRRSGSSW